MDWLSENWFWIIVAIAFIALHVFGHGGHGGHGGQGRSRHDDRDQNNTGAGAPRPGGTGHAH